MIKMIDLPYPMNALEPYYTMETLKLHYDIFIKDMWKILIKQKKS